MCKYIMRSKGNNNSVGHEMMADDLPQALAEAETLAIKHNAVVEVFERISICTPKIGVGWEGKTPAPPSARVADRAVDSQAQAV